MAPNRKKKVTLTDEQKEYMELYGPTGGHFKNYTDPKTGREWDHIQELVPLPRGNLSADEYDKLMTGLEKGRKKWTKKEMFGEGEIPLPKYLSNYEVLGPYPNRILGREPFQMMNSGGQLKPKRRTSKKPIHKRGGGVIGRNKIVRGYKKGGQV